MKCVAIFPNWPRNIRPFENLVAASPDLFFAGWYYGMKPGGEVTPDTLEPFGIKTMVLTESCVHLNKDPPGCQHEPAV